MGVGRKIAEVRKQKGLSQEHIAAKMKRTPQWLSKAERSKALALSDIQRVLTPVGFGISGHFIRHLNTDVLIGNGALCPGRR